MMSPDHALCPDENMLRIVALAGDTQAALAAVEDALTGYPLDARLHFLKGSLLIGLKRHVGAHASLSRAVEISPDYHLARFQLGLFELTSGEADAARRTWAPLLHLPESDCLRLFVTGLESLIEDRFEDCIRSLEEGIAANTQNAELSRDMELVIGQCREIIGKPASEAAGDGELSLTSLLLGTCGSSGRH